MNHVISLLVENQQGVMARIAGLFSGRGYNMESFTAGPTVDPSIARITLVCRGDEAIIDQIVKQLNRLVDVIKVIEFTGKRTIDRELALIKVRATESKRGEILRIIELYKGRVLDVGPESVIIEHSGTEQEIDALVALLGGFGIREMVRTGTIALSRGSGAIDLEAILRAGPEPARTQAEVQALARKRTMPTTKDEQEA